MNVKELELRGQLKEAIDRGQKIASQAESEGREFTDEERQKVRGAIDRAKQIREKLEPYNEQTQLKSLLENWPPAKGDVGPGGNGPKGTSWGKAMLAHLEHVGAKALTPSGQIVAPPSWSPGVVDMGQRARWLRDIIPSTPALSGEEYSYWQQTVRTNLAAPVAKGALKPTSIFTAELITDKVQTVAHLSEAVPRQDVADSSSLMEFLESELRLGLMLAADGQILTGDGTPPNFQGLTTATGIQTHAVGADSRIVALRKAKTKAELSLSQPSHYVLHPADWEDVDLEQDNEARYFLGGPVETSTPRLWGLPVHITEATTAGTGFVGAFSTEARIYPREGVQVTWSENVDDDFTLNMVRFRAEERLNVAWLRPFAFVKVTGL